ncbi:MAG: ABC transporter ATP-binding protein [Candidatus Bathyarchaeia archaeon]|nr:ABC transporter ATP-binding protein [Candidatus Bathyarchaeota archaeon]
MKVLEVINVTKRFGGLVALNDVCLHINKGEIVGLIGPNGSGKTTLFNVISGTFKPDSGMIYFEGKNITGLSPYKICKLGVARTFQIPKPFPNMTVYENLFASACFGRAEGNKVSDIKKDLEEILERLELKKKSNILASNLTIFDQRMLELARALSIKPKLLLLDEVLAGLNPMETMHALRIINDLQSRDGITIFMIEHNMRAIMEISDRIIVLHYGNKIAEGTPEEVAREPEVIKVYLGEAYAGS